MSEAKQKIKFKIVNIQVKDKSLVWTMKIKSLHGIPESKNSYQAEFIVDDEFFDHKISIVSAKIKERQNNPDMFGASERSIKDLNKEIEQIEDARSEAEGLEIKEFTASISVADFDKNTLQFQIPENRIEEIIKIRKNIEAYFVVLK